MKKNPFANVVDIALLRSLCEDFTRLTGFATALLDMEGNVLVACGWQEVCTRFHRVAGGTALKCRESDTILADRLARGENYYIYRCGNGLTDVAVPIVMDGTQVARLYSGQFLSAPPDLGFFRRQAAEHGLDEASYLDAVRKVPIVSEEQVRQAMNFLCRLAEIIVRMGITNKKVDDANLIVKNSQAVLFRWKTCAGWPIEYVSENVVQFGYTPEELTSREVPYTSMVHPEDLERISSLVDEHYRQGDERFQREYRIITKEGGVRWVEECTVSQRDAEGRITHYQGIVIDITERKQAERAMRENEERLRLAMTAANQGFYDLDLCAGTAKISPEYATMLGYEPEEYNSSLDFWTRQIHPDDRDRTLAVLGAVVAGELDSYSIEYRLRCKSGEWKWILSRGKTTDYLDDGAPARLMGIHTDISERVHTEEALRQANLVVENSPVVLFRWLATPGWPVEMVSRNVSQFGYTPEELLSGAVSFASIIHPDDLERVSAEVTEHSGSGCDLFEQEYRIITRDGAVRWLYDRTVVERDSAGKVTHFQGIVIDISERRRAEETLRASEERFRSLVETSSDWIWEVDSAGIYTYASPKVADILGYDPREVMGKAPFDLMPTEEAERMRARFTELTGSGRSFHGLENVNLHKNGQTVVLETSGVPIFGPDGKLSGYRGMDRDITKRKRAEEALKESEEKFRTLAETSPTPIILIRGEKIVYANEAVIQFTGYSQEELQQMRFWEFVHDDFKELVRERGMARERGETVPKRYDHKIVTKGGEERWAVVSGAAVMYQGKPARIVTLLDFTEAKHAQERMQAALVEKVVLLQEVHHRVKNNMQIITSLLELQADYIHDENSRKNIRECQSRIRSMAIVHEQLYQSEDFSHIDFSAYVNSLVSYLCLSYGIDQGRIRIVVDVGISLDMVRAIPCGLIVNELVANALKYAFPGGAEGTITVSGRYLGNGMATLGVSDNGVGLPAGLDFRNTETMGLQIVNLLARQVRGSIAYHGDGGASFIITFPAEPAGAGAGRSAPPASGGDRH